MSRSSAPIWTACRQRVENLPPCPIHLSDPQYFSLAFERHCQVRKSVGHMVWNDLLTLQQRCLEPQAKEIIWTFWARHCLNCWKEMSVYQVHCWRWN